MTSPEGPKEAREEIRKLRIALQARVDECDRLEKLCADTARTFMTAGRKLERAAIAEEKSCACRSPGEMYDRDCPLHGQEACERRALNSAAPAALVEPMTETERAAMNRAADCSVDEVVCDGELALVEAPKLHQGACTCPACQPLLWAAGIKGSKSPGECNEGLDQSRGHASNAGPGSSPSSTLVEAPEAQPAMDRLWQIHRIATQSRVLPEDVDRIAELSEGFAPIPPCSICKQSHAEPEQDCPQLRAGASAAIPEAPEALRLIARMLPYVQQMEAADAAEMDAQQCLIHEVEKCLAAVSAATAETPESLATPAFLRAIIAALIEGIRSVEIDRREWYTHIAQPLQDAYQAIGGPKDLGLTPEEIAKLRDESPGASAAARVTGWRPPDRADLISMAASVAREARRHLDNGHKHHANILQMASAVLLNLSDSALFAAGQAATPNTLLKDDTP